MFVKSSQRNRFHQPRVNFINVLSPRYSYKISVSKITKPNVLTKKNLLNLLSYEKRAHKILMKLTPMWEKPKWASVCRVRPCETRKFSFAIKRLNDYNKTITMERRALQFQVIGNVLFHQCEMMLHSVGYEHTEHRALLKTCFFSLIM
jgi:hypothetical protein